MKKARAKEISEAGHNLAMYVGASSQGPVKEIIRIAVTATLVAPIVMAAHAQRRAG